MPQMSTPTNSPYLVCPGVNCPGTGGGWTPPALYIGTNNILFGIQYVYFAANAPVVWNLRTSDLNDLQTNYVLSGVIGAYISVFSIALRKCNNSSHYYDPGD